MSFRSEDSSLKYSKYNDDIDDSMNVALVVKTAKPKVNIVEKIVAPIDPRPLRSIDKIKLEETDFLLKFNNRRLDIQEAVCNWNKLELNLEFKLILKTDEDLTDIKLTKRNYKQLQSLNQKLHNVCVDNIIYKVPEPLILKKAKGPDEEKQLLNIKLVEIKRYLNWIIEHPQIKRLGIVKEFLDSESTFNEEALSNGNNILKRLSLLPRTLLLQQHFERGFRIYRAMEIFKENDHEEFQRRKSYLIILEDSYSELLNVIDKLSNGRRDVGIRLSHLGDACLSCLDSKYKIGPFIKCEEKRMFKKFDKNLNCLAILTDDIKVLINIQANIEELQIKHLVDEYLYIISSLKELMNIRTERLLNLKNIFQIYDKSKGHYNRNLTETEDESRDNKELISKQELEKAEAQLEQSQLNLTQEFIHYEKYKVENLMKTLMEYTNLQLKVEVHHLEILNEGYKQFKADKS